MNKKISIIVPFKEMNPFVEECLTHCLELDYDHFDIILLPDDPMPSPADSRIKIVPTGPVFPSIKRNIAIEETDAVYCAFIDSDAYPVDNKWLKNAYVILQEEDVGCVGGPNSVPPYVSSSERIGTEILFCRLGRGALPSRHTRGKPYYSIKELPSSNLVCKTDLLRQIEGFPTDVLTGEDAFMCFKIAEAGYKIIYSNDVAVYHHRRPFPGPCLRSFFVYGRDKGIIFKKHFSPDKLFYGIPALTTVFFCLGWILALYSSRFRLLFFAILGIYCVLVFIQSMCFTTWPVKFYGLIGIPLSHIAHGIGFIKGVLFPAYKMGNE